MYDDKNIEEKQSEDWLQEYLQKLYESCMMKVKDYKLGRIQRYRNNTNNLSIIQQSVKFDSNSNSNSEDGTSKNGSPMKISVIEMDYDQVYKNKSSSDIQINVIGPDDNKH